jgi:hypothetical protein
MFMTRLVRNPMITRRCRKRYKICVGNRIGEFPPNDEAFCRIIKSENIQYSLELSYDAEATTWLLLSRAITVKPVEEDSKNHIGEYLWAGLAGGEGANDPRGHFMWDSPKAVFHPAYRGLDEPLRSLCEQLYGYHELGVWPPREQDLSKMKDEPPPGLST